jgi:hypothetical protein
MISIKLLFDLAKAERQRTELSSHPFSVIQILETFDRFANPILSLSKKLQLKLEMYAIC